MAEIDNSQALSIDGGNEQSQKPKYQWLRFAEVIIKDFTNQTETKIPNDLEIEFEFFKSVDDSTQNSTGTIKIKGLSEERCQSFSESGGEVILNCGYQGQISTLFRAYIMHMNSEISDNTTITTIECSMNLQEFYYSSSPSLVSNGVSSKDISLNILLRNYAYSCGFADIKYYASNDLTEQEKKECEDIFNSLSFAYEFVGTASEALDGLCQTFELKRETKITDSGSVLQLTASKKTLDFVRDNNFKRLSPEQVKKNATELMSFRTYYEAISDKALNTAVILSKETGLLSSKIEYKIAKAYRDQQILSTDQETFKSQQQTEKFISSEKKRKAKYDKKVAERKEKGLKELKPFKYKTVKNEIQVNRKYLKVVALLNPKVKPQSPVVVVKRGYTDTGVITEEAIVGRARSVTYKGNNKSGDWSMELYVETSPENDSDLTPEQIQQLKDAQSEGQTYSKNPNQGGSSYSPTLSGYKISGSQVRDMLKHPVSNGAFSSTPVNKETAEFAKILDADGLGGDINAFTSFTGGKSHAGGYQSHYNGFKFDLDLKSGDSVQAYARAIQRVEALAEQHGYDVIVYAEKRGWSPSTGYHFRGGGGSHLDILVRGRK